MQGGEEGGVRCDVYLHDGLGIHDRVAHTQRQRRRAVPTSRDRATERQTKHQSTRTEGREERKGVEPQGGSTDRPSMTRLTAGTPSFVWQCQALPASCPCASSPIGLEECNGLSLMPP